MLACREKSVTHRKIVLGDLYREDLPLLASVGIRRPISKQKADGERFAQSAGVELKFDDSEESIDWTSTFGWTDTKSIVVRSMNKYRSVVPSEVPLKQLKVLVRGLPGFVDTKEPTDQVLTDIRSIWQSEYDDNLEKVVFDNLSSYEP